MVNGIAPTRLSPKSTLILNIKHLLRNARSTTRTVWQVRLGEFGRLVDWLGAGLQTLLGWFDSNIALNNARVVELADTLDLGSRY